MIRSVTWFACSNPDENPRSGRSPLPFFKMKIYILTDMEGISGINRESQCYGGKGHPDYESARHLLMGDVNSAIAGAFDGGAKEVTVLDGHGDGQNFILEELDPRATLDALFHPYSPLSALDETYAGLFVVGQHARAGTLNAFLDHTQSPRLWVNYLINGQPCGELAQAAAYAGYFGVPLLYCSGDVALCREAEEQFPGVVTTPVKEGLGWARARCWPVPVMRERIRKDACRAMSLVGQLSPWVLQPPIEITLELAYTGAADAIAWKKGVERLNARTVRWRIDSAREIYWVP